MLFSNILAHVHGLTTVGRAFLTRAFGVTSLLAASASLASAQITVYSNDLAGFNAEAGSPPVSVDFDAIAIGTNLTGTTFSGIEFGGPGAPLIVVDGASTFTPPGAFSGTINESTNRLLPTTGLNVLSPGGNTLGAGPDTAIENDDLTLTFLTPVSAFGFDHISQSQDGFSFTAITVFDVNNVVLFGGTVSVTGPGGGAPGGADFWGIVSTTSNISRIEINEQDSDSTFPDANIGFDTFRFVAPVTVPEANTSVLLGLAAMPLALAVARRRN